MEVSGSKRKQDVLCINTKRVRKKVIHEVANKIMCGNKDITDSYLIYPWLTHHMVNGYVRRMKSKIPKSTDIVVLNTNDVAISNVTTLVDSSIKKGGRPKGSTAASKVDIQNKIKLAKDKISIIYKYKR